MAVWPVTNCNTTPPCSVTFLPFLFHWQFFFISAPKPSIKFDKTQSWYRNLVESLFSQAENGLFTLFITACYLDVSISRLTAPPPSLPRSLCAAAFRKTNPSHSAVCLTLRLQNLKKEAEINLLISSQVLQEVEDEKELLWSRTILPVGPSDRFSGERQ